MKKVKFSAVEKSQIKSITEATYVLLEEMKKRNLVGFKGAHVQGDMLKIDNVCTLWPRDTSLFGYFPGEMHTFFVLTPLHFSIQHLDMFDVVIKKLHQYTKRLQKGTAKDTVTGEFSFPTLDLTQKPVLALEPMKLKKETRQMIQNMWDEICTDKSAS